MTMLLGQVTIRLPRRAGSIAGMIRTKDDLFRSVWGRLPGRVRWRLVAAVDGHLGELTLGMIAREVALDGAMRSQA